MRIEDSRHQEMSRGKLPHISRRAWAIDIFFRDLYVQVCPQPAQAAARLLRAVLLFQEVHKVQHFLLLLRRQIAEFFDNLLFYGHGDASSGDLGSLYACWMRFRAI